jgi:hypothetical protein
MALRGGKLSCVRKKQKFCQEEKKACYEDLMLCLESRSILQKETCAKKNLKLCKEGTELYQVASL